MKNLIIIALLMCACSLQAQVTSRSVLQTYFQTGDKPTQEQYYKWLASFWHKYDSIPASMISGLPTGGGPLTLENLTFDNTFTTNPTLRIYNGLYPLQVKLDTTNYIATKNDLTHGTPVPVVVDTGGSRWAVNSIVYGNMTPVDGKLYLIWNHVSGTTYVGHEKQIMHSVGGVPTYDTASLGDLLTCTYDNDSLKSVFQLRDTGWAKLYSYITDGGNYVSSKMQIGTKNYTDFEIVTNSGVRIKIDKDGRIYEPKMIGIPANNYAKWDSATGERIYDTFSLAAFVQDVFVSNDSLYKKKDDVVTFLGKFGTGGGGGGTGGGNPDSLHSQLWSYYLNRANHTGTQAWSTITSTPTTLSGYGITDFNSTFDTRFSSKFTGTGYAKYSSGTLSYAASIPLSTDISGILPVANGGTGTSTPSLIAGNNINITGIWPNQTINSNSFLQSDSIVVTRNSLGAFNLDNTNVRAAIGIRLQNTTAATSSVIQNSPFFQISGNAINSTTSVSYPSEFSFGVIPANSSNAQTYSLGAFIIRHNSTAIGLNIFSLAYNGFLTVPGGFSTIGTIVGASITGNSNIVSPQIAAGTTNPFSGIAYKTTNGGSSLAPTFMVSTPNTSGTQGLISDQVNNNLLGFTIKNDAATKTPIQVARINLTNTTYTAGSEAGDVSIYTGLNGGTERIRIGFNGVTTFFKPISYSGSAPSYSLGAGAGTGATASVTGNDAAGYITINTGTSPTTGGDVITVTFNTALSNTPTSIQLRSCNDAGAISGGLVYPDQASASTTSFKIKNISTTALPASTTLKFYYTITQ